MDNINDILRTISILLIPLLFAITLHEAAHGWVANKLGDNTAKMLGRLTINPIPHIDIIGTILIPLASYFLAGFIFGYAKPVPINSRKLRKINRDLALIAIAGPLANLFMAIFWGCLFSLGKTISAQSIIASYHQPLMEMARYGIIINIILLSLNLLPIPPLDGSKVLAYFLPKKLRYHYSKLEPFGLFILLAILFLGGFKYILAPIIRSILYYFNLIF